MSKLKYKKPKITVLQMKNDFFSFYEPRLLDSIQTLDPNLTEFQIAFTCSGCGA